MCNGNCVGSSQPARLWGCSCDYIRLACTRLQQPSWESLCQRGVAADWLCTCLFCIARFISVHMHALPTLSSSRLPNSSTAEESSQLLLDCPSPRSEPPSSCPIASHRASRCPLLHMSTLQVDLSAAAATKHPLQSSPKAATWTVSRLSGGPHLIGSTRTACMTTQAPSDHTI